MKKSVFLNIIALVLLMNLFLLSVSISYAVPDDDSDGVPNCVTNNPNEICDKCPTTQTTVVDQFGCSCEQKNCQADNNPCTDDCGNVELGRVACNVPNNNQCPGGYCSGGQCIKQNDNTNVCTQDVQQCPDGSIVGREPANNCNFKLCPTTSSCGVDYFAVFNQCGSGISAYGKATWSCNNEQQSSSGSQSLCKPLGAWWEYARDFCNSNCDIKTTQKVPHLEISSTKILQGDKVTATVSNAMPDSQILLYLINDVNGEVISRNNGNDFVVIGVTNEEGTWTQQLDSTSWIVGRYRARVKVADSYSNNVVFHVIGIPTVTLTATSNPTPIGSYVNLKWESTNADSCTPSDGKVGDGWIGVTGKKSLSNVQMVGPITSNTRYTITCTGAGGSATSSVVVETTVEPLVVTFTANPNPVEYNTASTLSWTASGATITTCTASGDWSGTKAREGSESTGPLTSSKTYTLTCKGQGDALGVASVTVNVVQPSNKVPTLSISPTKILQGNQVNVAVSNAEPNSQIWLHVVDKANNNVIIEKAPLGTTDQNGNWQNKFDAIGWTIGTYKASVIVAGRSSSEVEFSVERSSKVPLFFIVPSEIVVGTPIDVTIRNGEPNSNIILHFFDTTNNNVLIDNKVLDVTNGNGEFNKRFDTTGWQIGNFKATITIGGNSNSALFSVKSAPVSAVSCKLEFKPAVITINQGSQSQSTILHWESSNDADQEIPYTCTGNIGSGKLIQTAGVTGQGDLAFTPTSTQTCKITVVGQGGALAECSSTINVIQPSNKIPKLSITPTTFIQGQSELKVTITEAEPNSEIKFDLIKDPNIVIVSGEPLKKRDGSIAKTDGNGRFEQSYDTTKFQPGTYKAVVFVAGQKSKDDVSFNVQAAPPQPKPALSISPNEFTPTPNQEIHVTISNAKPDTDIKFNAINADTGQEIIPLQDLKVKRADGTEVTARTSGNGGFVHDYDSKDFPPGKYTFKVSVAGADSDPVTVTIKGPVLKVEVILEGGEGPVEGIKVTITNAKPDSQIKAYVLDTTDSANPKVLLNWEYLKIKKSDGSEVNELTDSNGRFEKSYNIPNLAGSFKFQVDVAGGISNIDGFSIGASGAAGQPGAHGVG